MTRKNKNESSVRYPERELCGYCKDDAGRTGQQECRALIWKAELLRQVEPTDQADIMARERRCPYFGYTERR